MGRSGGAVRDWFEEHRGDVVLFAIMALLLASFGHVYGWNEETRMLQTEAFVEDRALAITSSHEYTGDKILYRGAYYADKPPLSSILGIPAYILSRGYKPGTSGYYRQAFDDWGGTVISPVVPNTLFHILFVLFTAALPGALLVVLIRRRVAEEYGPGVAWFTAVAFGAGTLLFVYGAVAVGVVLAALFGYCSYLFTIRERTRRHRILAGMCGGLAVATEYYAIVVPAVLFTYLFLRERRSVHLYVLGGFAGVLPLLLFNVAVSGLDPLLFQDSPLKNNLTNKTGPAVSYLAGFALNAGSTDLAAYTVSQAVINGLKLLVYPVRGLFFYSPLLILSFFGIYRARNGERRDRVTLLPFALFGSVFLFNTVLHVWWAGSTYGPRYLVLAIPFLSLPFAAAITDLRTRATAAVLFAVGVLQNLVGSRGAITAQGSAVAKRMGIEPGHRYGLAGNVDVQHGVITVDPPADVLAGELSLPRLLVQLQPHSLGNYVAHVQEFLTHGPPLLPITTLLTTPPWDIRLGALLYADRFKIPVWTGEGGTVMLAGGWIVLAALLIGTAFIARRRFLPLLRENRTARIVVALGCLGLILVPVQTVDHPPLLEPWSFQDDQLYMGDVPVSLQGTYPPHPGGVWFHRQGAMLLHLEGSEEQLVLGMRVPDPLVGERFLVRFNGRVILNATAEQGAWEPGPLPVDTRAGANRLSIESTGGCVSVEDDPRCLSIALTHLDVQ